MSEPEVVFCKKGHIYDKSVELECPYCKQIEKKTGELEAKIDPVPQKKKAKSFGGFGRKKNDQDDDLTAYLSSQKKRKEDQIDTPNESQDTEPEEDDHTELIWDFGGSDQKKKDEGKDRLSSRGKRKEKQSDTRNEKQTEDSEEDDRTELIVQNKSEPDDDETELRISVSKEKKNTGVIKNRDTIPNRETRRASGRKVIGWLVCTQSEYDYGLSIELVEGMNYVCFDHDGRLIVYCEECGENAVEAVIYRDKATGIFQIKPAEVRGVKVNDRVLLDCSSMEPYSRIDFSSASAVFFPAVGVFGFEWR